TRQAAAAARRHLGRPARSPLQGHRGIHVDDRGATAGAGQPRAGGPQPRAIEQAVAVGEALTVVTF
ncbi:hypothetical protein, partial [Streptomyces sp. PSKA30]|uniref:hypothetical protein n=1 Tax=Streptomyces sp. PSKA30 TaxID=2874597 RepID=UPI001CD144C7